MNKRLSTLILFLTTLISVFAVWQASQVAFDYDPKRFFPYNQPETDLYQEFLEDFGGDDNYLLIGLERSEGIFDSTFLMEVERLTAELEKLPGVQSIQSPTRLGYYIREPLFGTLTPLPYLHPEKPSQYANDSINVFSHPRLSGSFFSEDGKAVSIFIRQEKNPSDAQCNLLADTLPQILSPYSFDAFHTVGRCIGQTYYRRLMRHEVVIFVGASIILVALFLALLFRKMSRVLVPLTIVGLAVLWTVALMKLTGQPLDIISNVIPSILMVVGLSAVIHIIAKYEELLQRGVPADAALKQALRKVGSANVMTALTTAIGFMTLLTAGVTPIETFGLFATVGVVLAFGLTYALVPSVIPLLPSSQSTVKSQQSDWLDQQLHFLLRKLIHGRRWILLFSALLMAVSLMGVRQLKVNSFLLEDLKQNNPLQQDFQFYEDRFAGARSFEMLLTLPNEGYLDSLTFWQLLDSTHQFLEEDYGVGQLVSPLTFLKTLNQAWEGGEVDAFRLPEGQRRLKQVWSTLKKSDRLSDISAYRNGPVIRISGLMPDVGSQALKERNVHLAQWTKRHLPSEYQYQLTGFADLMDLSNLIVSQNVFQGLLIALVLIGLLMGLLFRSLRMVLIALIPNILPLLMIGGLMGFFSIDLKFSTAIIFTIAFGIAVDDTIHFMNRLRWELWEGRSWAYAIKRAFLSTGRAIILTSLILAGGFMVLTLSDFLGTLFIGLLVSLTLVFAVVADLFLLPVLLWYLRPKGSAKPR